MIGVDFDSDGNSETPNDRNWTELTVVRRDDSAQRIDIDRVVGEPLLLKVTSDYRTLALRAATFLAQSTGGPPH